MITLYDKPRVAYFNSYRDGQEAILPEIIIGEDDHTYLIKSYISKIGYWDTDNVQFTEIKHVWIGIHKSRLIQYAEIEKYTIIKQLTLPF